MESQLDKLGRNLKSDEYWTSTTIYRPSSLLRSRFLDVTQRSPKEPLGGALRDIQKTAAKETIARRDEIKVNCIYLKYMVI